MIFLMFQEDDDEEVVGMCLPERTQARMFWSKMKVKRLVCKS
jgi:hypothetical protein